MNKWSRVATARIKNALLSSNMGDMPDGYALFTHEHRLNYIGDTLFFHGQGYYQPAWNAGPICVSDAAGLPRSLVASDRALEFLTPSPVNSAWSYPTDLGRYGYLLTELASLTSGVSAAGKAGVLHEKDVYHGSVKGSLSDGLLISRFEEIDAPGDEPGIPFPDAIERVKTGQHRSNAARAVDILPTGQFIFEEGSVEPISAAVTWDAISQLEKYAFLIQVGGIAGLPLTFTPHHSGELVWQREYRQFHYEKNEKSSTRWDLKCSYEYTIRYVGLYPVPDPGFWSTYKVTWDVTLELSPTNGNNDPFAMNSIDDFPSFKISNRSTVELISYDGILDFPDPPVPPRLQVKGQQWETLINQPISDFNENFRSFWASPRLPGLNRVEELERVRDKFFADIRPSSFLAACDALEKYIGVLKANHIENLTQLSSILSLAPDLSGLGPLLADLAAGDITVLPRIIDFIADFVLEARFSRDPTIADAAELLSKDIRGRLESLTTAQDATIYGKFRFEFSQNELSVGPGKLVLETRGKIRVHLDLSTLLTSVISANAVGLLPTLKRLWNLVPFSFVVDWFTNMSRRFDAVDKQLMYLAIRTDFCLWSYKLTYYPSEGELAEFNLVLDDELDPFRLSTYDREFSLYMPGLRDSKFDFLKVTQPPDLLTVGCLVWQVL